jgi:hypothetical protein
MILLSMLPILISCAVKLKLNRKLNKNSKSFIYCDFDGNPHCRDDYKTVIKLLTNK